MASESGLCSRICWIKKKKKATSNLAEDRRIKQFLCTSMFPLILKINQKLQCKIHFSFRNVSQQGGAHSRIVTVCSKPSVFSVLRSNTEFCNQSYKVSEDFRIYVNINSCTECFKDWKHCRDLHFSLFWQINRQKYILERSSKISTVTLPIIRL